MQNDYKICVTCLMDSTDPNIYFNSNGVCNHCLSMQKTVSYYSNIDKTKVLTDTLNEIKRVGRNSQYDCLIGVSGGVDSSYVAFLVKKHGLRPLAVHLDNGWNSELAVDNIKMLLEKLEIPLYTYVLDWEEFKNLQVSFLKASVPDLEIPSDHAINAILYKIAAKEKIKFIIYGTNYSSESILPKAWSSGHFDWGYIKKISKEFGKIKLKTFPHFTLINLFFFKRILKIRSFSILDYIDYDKEKAKNILVESFGWRDYGGKHYESIYTRFYQGYILPTKFHFDKRRAHYSTLVNSGQMSREEALQLMTVNQYTKDEILKDKEFVAKKFELSITEFEKLLKLPNRRYDEFRKYDWMDTLKLEEKLFYYISAPVRVVKYLKKKIGLPKN